MIKLQSKIPKLDAIMHMCEYWANARSKDPNTKVGACVYNISTGDMYFGYNGFAPNFDDTEERWAKPAKYEYVIHAEENAVRKAVSSVGKLDDRYYLICTHKPCHKCMMRIAAHGIRIVFYKHKHDDSKISDEISIELGIRLEQFMEGISWIS